MAGEGQATYLERASCDNLSQMVAKDGIEPPTPAFSGPLARALSSLESAHIIERISVVAFSIWDGLGRFGLVSTVRWSHIGRGSQNPTHGRERSRVTHFERGANFK